MYVDLKTASEITGIPINTLYHRACSGYIPSRKNLDEKLGIKKCMIDIDSCFAREKDIHIIIQLYKAALIADYYDCKGLYTKSHEYFEAIDRLNDQCIKPHKWNRRNLCLR